MTGTIFGLLALVHVWRAVVEWPLVGAEAWYVLAIGVAAGGLSVWAFRLLPMAARP